MEQLQYHIFSLNISLKQSTNYSHLSNTLIIALFYAALDPL